MTFALSPFLFPDFGGFEPDRYPVPQDHPAVQPAGWAFAIWGLVYLGLIAHAAFGLFQHKDDAAWDRGRPALFIWLAVGTIWLPVPLASPIWATVLIWAMLISVLVSLYQMRGARPHWQANWPVALYAGWLPAASFVSIGLLLAGYGVLPEIPSAIIALVLATGFALFHQVMLGHWTYGAAVAWGFAGIAVANLGSQLPVAVLAAVAALLILGLVGYQRSRA